MLRQLRSKAPSLQLDNNNKGKDNKEEKFPDGDGAADVSCRKRSVLVSFGFLLGILVPFSFTMWGIISPMLVFPNQTNQTKPKQYAVIPVTHPISQHGPDQSAAICAIVVDEEAYIDEWVDYHYGLGFTAFYIYDNSPDNEMRQWAVEKGPHVTVKHFPGKAKQMEAYKDCAQTYGIRNKHTWVAFFDVDEFLVLRKHRHVVDFLHEHAREGQIGINWFWFTTSGRLLYEPLPVTQRFVYREQDVNQHVKSIIYLQNMDMTRRVHPHYAYLKDNRHQTDTNGREFKGPYNIGGPTDTAVLHHYWTKSRKEFVRKKMRGRSDSADSNVNLTDAEQQADSMPSGAVFDDSAWKLLKELVPKYRVFDAYESWHKVDDPLALSKQEAAQAQELQDKGQQ
jgi:hypothetical protein